MASVVGGSVAWALSKVQGIVRNDHQYLSLSMGTRPGSSSSSFRDKGRERATSKGKKTYVYDDLETLPRWSSSSSSGSSSRGSRGRNGVTLGEIMALYPSIVNFGNSKVNSLHEILSIPNPNSHNRNLGASDAIARYTPGGNTNMRGINELEGNPSLGQGPVLFKYTTSTNIGEKNNKKISAAIEVWP